MNNVAFKEKERSFHRFYRLGNANPTSLFELNRKRIALKFEQGLNRTSQKTQPPIFAPTAKLEKTHRSSKLIFT